MSNIRQRGDKWQARVTVEGETSTKTFTKKIDAEKWCRHQQVLMERGEHRTAPALTLTLAKAVARYEKEVLPTRRGKYAEKYLLAFWKQCAFAAIPLAKITPADIAGERDRLLQRLATGSVRRYIDTLSGLFSLAKSDWQAVATNPVSEIRKPANGRPRERRLMPGELERIIAQAGEAPDLPEIIMLAAETGMRRSEILGLEWRNINLNKRQVVLPLTKNGESRCVPLSTKAGELLSKLPRRLDGQVFKKNGCSLSDAFQRAVKRARGIYEKEQLGKGNPEEEVARDSYLSGLRFHDLRHERISSLVEGGFNLVEVAAISGHKTMQCLKRYAHIRPEHLLAKLDAMPVKANG